MIRAHLATFPIRSGILMQTVQSILPQVDRLFICLNDYDHVPEELAQEPKIEAMIPDRDLKDAGKFAFVPEPDDLVFTIDDDILYPPDYVSKTLAMFKRLDPQHHVLGHLGHAWLAKTPGGPMGWQNWLFRKKMGNLRKVDLVGTGTACQLGKNFPRLDQIESAAGFVDLRHARLHAEAGRWLWMLPHPAEWMVSTMTPDLKSTSLLYTVNKAAARPLRHEVFAVIGGRTPHSGKRFRELRAQGLLPPQSQD